MTQLELAKAKNPDLRASLAAMLRAAEMARKTAIQTDTETVLAKDGNPLRITAEEQQTALNRSGKGGQRPFVDVRSDRPEEWTAAVRCYAARYSVACAGDGAG